MDTPTWNRRTVVATVCLGALLSAGVIGSATAQTPVSGGHFRRALSSDPANLDPALTNTSRAIAVKMTIFDSLLRQNPKTLAIEPGAAEWWSVGSDGKILTFRLHRDSGQRPVGSGPFIFVSWSRDSSVLLKENPSYWEGRPYISALEFRIIPDLATLQAEFETGRLDFILLEDPTYRRYADDPQWKPYVVEVAELFTRHMGMNTTKPPLDDVRVRQAINFAIDKATTVRTVLQDQAL